MNVLVVSAFKSDFSIEEQLYEEHSINYAQNMQQALTYVENDPMLDILVIDTNLPDGTAFELISRVRESEFGKDLFVILITESECYSDEIEGLRLGADEYIRKPIRKESFSAVLHLYQKFSLQRSEKAKFKELAMLYDALFQQAPVGISVSHSEKPLEGRRNELFEVNKSYMEITGRNREELIATGWSSITHPEDIKKELPLYQNMQNGLIDGYEMEKRFIKPDGSIVWVHLIATTLDISGYEENSHICIIEDITQRKQAEMALDESERSREVLLSNMPGLVYRCKNDEHWTMEFLSEKSVEILGYEPEELIDNKEISFNDIILPEYRDGLKAVWREKLKERKQIELTYEIKTKSGETKWIFEVGEGVYDADGKTLHLEGIIFDHTNRRKTEEELKFATEHHIWTGIYNRRYLDEFYEEKRHKGIKRALVLVNMSNLSSLNMSYGYGYYRNIVRRIGETLSSFVREDKVLFHVSENLFIFYIDKYKDKKELEVFSRDISKALEEVLALELIGGGIGLVEISESNSDDLDKAISNALIASEVAALKSGKNIPFSFFDTKMENRLLRKELIKQELARVASGESDKRLYLEFQPIIDLKSNNTIWGFEALARFRSETLGRIDPLEFIPIAEETKLIIPLGEKIIRQAFSFQKQVEKAGYKDSYIAINLSAIQLREDTFCNVVESLAKQEGIRLERVSFEITESVIIENYGELNRCLAKLKDMGVGIAIDDFGTGYSSLSRERELRVSSLKVDKYFMDKLMTLESFNDSILGDIISMGHKLDNYVIAEGVEHLSQMEYLKTKNCDGLQGYIISNPLNEKNALKFMKDYQAKN